MTPSFVTVFYNNYIDDVSKNFKAFLDHDKYIDLVFVCRNNKKVGAHQIVLGCLSKLFYSVFIENLNTMKEKIMYIYVPDIRAKIMKYILQFIYCGKTMLNKEELSEFNEDIKLLGMPLDHFQPFDDNAEDNNSKSSNVTDSLPSLRNKELPMNISPETVDLTAPSKSERNPLISNSTAHCLNKSTVFSPDMAVGTMQSLSSEIPFTSQTKASTEQKTSLSSNLPLITGVRALDENFASGTPLNSNSESLSCSSGVSNDKKICGPSNSIDSPDAKILNLKNQDDNESSEIVSPVRKRKKSSICREQNKKVIDACINLDVSDEESDIITIS